MKRLLKKAFGKTLWHGTNLSSFQSIVETGAIYPNEQEGAGSNDAPDELYEGFTFFATTFNTAMGYAKASSSFVNADPSIVIEIDVPENALLADDNDFTKAKNWQDSARAIEQVKVNGAITTDYFRTITFYDVSGNLVGDTPFSSWENFFYDKAGVIMGEEKAMLGDDYYLDYSDTDDDIDFGDVEDIFYDDEDEVTKQTAKVKTKRLLKINNLEI